MAIALSELVSPEHTAVLTCEMQRAIAGDLCVVPPVRDAVETSGIVPNIARLLAAARRRKARVVHNTYAVRADLAGVALNTRQIRAAVKASSLIIQGQPGADLMAELGPEEVDLVVHRLHGYTPFTGTGLDAVLRNLAVTTVIPVGVSLNECVLGTCLSAADLGYRIALPTDAVVAIPLEYGAEVVKYTLAAITTITTVDDIIAAWDAHGS
jgi:biuret amidohydrolase